MVLLLIGLIGALRQGEPPRQADAARQIVTLPPPRERGPLSLEEALRSRRSVRRFAGGPLSLVEVSQLLWAADHERGAAYHRPPARSAARLCRRWDVRRCRRIYHYRPIG
jgi:hypothetical protein